MRSLPLKTTEQVDLAKPLLAYCTVNYGREACDIVRGYIENFNSLRNDIANFQGHGGNENLLEIMRNYLKILIQVEAKFVFSEKKKFCANSF